MALVKQISALVNDAAHDAIGKNATITELDTSDIVSIGKALSSIGDNAYETFFSSLANRITKTIYFVRSYKGRARNIMRDESEYGAFVQKVYYYMPDAVDDAAWNIPQISPADQLKTYGQASPYDVESTIEVKGLVYGGQGAWAYEFIRPLEQIKTAFLNESAMMSFIDGMYVACENSYELAQNKLISTAANTAMAFAINGGKARNLLSEYNTLTSKTLTVAQALMDTEFLKYATTEISKTIEYMGEMSTLFNVDGYTTFTDKSNLVVEINSQFAKATESYLEADTYHKELVALPRYESIPCWQYSGTGFKFEDTSKINIKHSDLVTSNNESGVVEQGGIICFMHDIENVAAYFGNMKSWEMPNPRSDVMIHGEKARKGFAVDNKANAFVFYIAES